MDMWLLTNLCPIPHKVNIGNNSQASTYAVDSYKPVAGSLFVSITVNKYAFSPPPRPWPVSCL